jgi:hypothetical protein
MATIDRIALQRNVAVVRDDSIAVRPSRGQLLGPLIELGIAALAALLIATMIDTLPLAVLMVLLLISIVLGPVGVLGLVYSAIGSSFIIERKKQTARWQQGFLGLGIGTVELVPFRRIKRIEVVSDYESELNSGELQDVVQFEVVLVKDNDRRLTIGTIVAARPVAHMGAERANRLAGHIASIAEVESAPIILPAPEAETEVAQAPRPVRRRRRSRRVSPPPREV